MQEKFGNDYEKYINSLANSTYFSMGKNPNYVIKIARVSMNLKDIAKNIIHGIYDSIPYLLKEGIKHNKVK